MYSKIILTLDGSEVSQQAIPHATSLAKQTGASVILLQVIDSEVQILVQTSAGSSGMEPVGPIGADIAQETVAAERTDAQANLAAVKAQMAADGVTNVTTMIREGYAGDEIVNTADETKADMVVIATHGRSGLSRAILGSVADHVVRNTPLASVLLVRAQERDS